MSLLDASRYDLASPEGQAQALAEILGELNNQFNNANGSGPVTIAAYGSVFVDPTPFNPGQIFTKTYIHNLGYAPMFLIFQEIPPGPNKSVPTTFGSYPYWDGFMLFSAYTDRVALYINLQYNNSVSLDSYAYNFGFYIFNNPSGSK